MGIYVKNAINAKNAKNVENLQQHKKSLVFITIHQDSKTEREIDKKALKNPFCISSKSSISNRTILVPIETLSVK